MISLFRENSFSSIFLLFLTAVLVHYAVFFHAVPVYVATNDPSLLNRLVKQIQHSLTNGAITALYLLCIIVQAVWLQILFNSLKLFEKPNFVAALTYVLLSAAMPEWCSFSATLLYNFVLLIILNLLIRLYNNSKPKSAIFNVSFLVSISLILYIKAIIILPVLMLALAIQRPFRIKEWLTLLMGLALPVYLFLSITFLTNILPQLHNNNFYLYFNILSVKPNALFWIRSITLAIIVIASFIFWNNYIGRMVIQLRRSWYVVICFALIIPVQVFVIDSSTLTDWWMLVSMYAVVMACSFLYPKSLWLPNIFFLLLLVVDLFNNYTLITTR